jgi:hypothetical protein
MDLEEKARWKWAKDAAKVLDALAGRVEAQEGKDALLRMLEDLNKLAEYVEGRAKKGSPLCKRMVKRLSEADHVG